MATGRKRGVAMRLIDVDELIDELCSDIEDESFGEVVKAEILEWLDAQPVVLQWHKLIFTRNSDVEYINSGNRYTIENLPEYDEQVIVTNGKDVWIDGVWLSETDDDIDGVIAWMELPSYKETQND